MKFRRFKTAAPALIVATALVTSAALVLCHADFDGANVALAQESKDVPAWVTMPDPEFCRQNAGSATGNQLQRSTFAWQLFARLNQQVKEPDPGPGSKDTEFSAWELWASDPATFPGEGGKPSGPPSSRSGPNITRTAKLQITGQEVTRNDTAFDFILNWKLFQASTAKQILGTPTPNKSPRIDFPVGSIETKAQWMTAEKGETLPADMYTIKGKKNKTYGLLALHIMAKIKTYPNGPRTIDDPSWFWTTFEYYNNPDRPYLIGFVTYQDTLPYKDQVNLLRAAGLDGTKFAIPVNVPVFDSKTGKTSTVPGNSYVCNGTQYRFVGPDPNNAANMVNVVLGNSVLEAPFVVYSPPGSVNKFRGWNASCHSCHYEASGNSEFLANTFHSVTGHVQLGHDRNGEKLFPIDFEWSIPFAEQP